MKIPGFRLGLVCAAMVLALGCGSALADSKKAPQLFNSTGSDGSKDIAPVFIQKQNTETPGMVGGILHTKKSYGMKSANVASSAENVKKAQIAFEQAQAKQTEYNKQIRDSHLASIKASFEATKAKEVALSDALMRKNLEAAGIDPDRQVGPTPGMSKPPVDPYLGSNVVFTGKKKTGEDKPTRLFNTR